jgi:hypothetical protein
MRIFSHLRHASELLSRHPELKEHASETISVVASSSTTPFSISHQHIPGNPFTGKFAIKRIAIVIEIKVRVYVMGISPY